MSSSEFRLTSVSVLRSRRGPFARPPAMCHSSLSIMRIYFGFTVAGDRASLAAARRLVALLENLGHDVLTRHLVRDDARESIAGSVLARSTSATSPGSRPVTSSSVKFPDLRSAWASKPATFWGPRKKGDSALPRRCRKADFAHDHRQHASPLHAGAVCRCGRSRAPPAPTAATPSLGAATVRERRSP